MSGWLEGFCLGRGWSGSRRRERGRLLLLVLKGKQGEVREREVLLLL